MQVQLMSVTTALPLKILQAFSKAHCHELQA